MKLFHVVLTESPAGNQDWQVRPAPTPAPIVAAAAPLGRAMVYVLSPIVAKDERAARAHALTAIAEEGLRAN